MKSRSFSVGEFKARFSELLDLVNNGETIVVTYGRAKRPIAIFGPPAAKPSRKFNHLAGKLRVSIGRNWELTEQEFLGP